MCARPIVYSHRRVWNGMLKSTYECNSHILSGKLTYVVEFHPKLDPRYYPPVADQAFQTLVTQVKSIH